MTTQEALTVMKGISSLHQIPGIGEKVAQRIIECAGDEETAIKCIQAGDIRPFLEFNANVISQLVKAPYLNEGQEVDLFKTNEIKQTYNQLISVFRSFCTSDAGKALLYQFFPTLSENEIQRRHGIMEEAQKLIQGISDEESKQIKASIKVIETPLEEYKAKAFNIVVVTEEEDAYRELKDILDVPVRLLSTEEDAQLLEDYESIRYVRGGDERFIRVIENFDQSIILPEKAKGWQILPEKLVASFTQRKPHLDAMQAIFALLQSHGYVMDEKTQAALTTLQSLVEPGAENLEQTLAQLSPKIHACVDEINEEAASSIEQRQITGRELLEILSQVKKDDSALPSQFKEVIEEISRKHLTVVAQELSMDVKTILHTLDTSSYPISADEEEIRSVEKELRNAYTCNKFKRDQEQATILQPLLETYNHMLSAIAQVDMLLALGQVSKKFGLQQPQLVDSGIAFSQAQHFLLVHQHGRENIVPIDYHLGKDQRIAAVTGANSGGKTTLLDTVGQIQLLTQCGFYVPAQHCEVSLQEEIWYFGKNRGDKTAGAFETLLNSFAQITQAKEKKRLILADEIEAVTEPGAAAKIIASLLSFFQDDPKTHVCLVTHLGQDIARETDRKYVRIDGIEAKGLDENLNLVVERNPKMNYLATSTPELILERLARKNANPLYEHIFRTVKAQ